MFCYILIWYFLMFVGVYFGRRYVVILDGVRCDFWFLGNFCRVCVLSFMDNSVCVWEVVLGCLWSLFCWLLYYGVWWVELWSIKCVFWFCDWCGILWSWLIIVYILFLVEIVWFLELKMWNLNCMCDFFMDEI